MGREKEVEKKFTEYLDRILAGEEIKADPAMDEELRAALDFARKISSLGAVPSAQYQARLKASLLQKLEEQEARKKEARGSFWGIFRSHPVWQGAVALLLVIIVITIVWRAGFFQPSITAPAHAPAATTAVPTTTAAAPTTTAGTLVSVDAKTDKLAYQPGETVKIEISMKNVSEKPLTDNGFPAHLEPDAGGYQTAGLHLPRRERDPRTGFERGRHVHLYLERDRFQRQAGKRQLLCRAGRPGIPGKSLSANLE